MQAAEALHSQINRLLTFLRVGHIGGCSIAFVASAHSSQRPPTRLWHPPVQIRQPLPTPLPPKVPAPLSTVYTEGGKANSAGQVGETAIRYRHGSNPHLKIGNRYCLTAAAEYFLYVTEGPIMMNTWGKP